MASHDDFAAATRRAERRRRSGPSAVAARYDRRSKRVIVRLSSGLDIAFLPGNVQGLETATPDQLRDIGISPSGFGLTFPRLDADIYLPGLLEGFLGSRAWMAARLGAQGGKATSQAKATAARANGARGGRPRKRAATGANPE